MSEGGSKYSILLTASDQTREAFEAVKNNTESLGSKLEIMRGAFAAAAIAAAAAVAVMIKGSIDAADAMGKAAQKVGTTTEMLSGLKYAAALSDVSFEALQKSLGKLSSNAYAAATSGGEAATAFKTLGINVKGTDGHLKDSGTVLEELAGKFSKMPDSAEKSALAIKLFGKAGLDMIPLLNSGSEGLAQMREEAERLGIIIGGDAAKSAEEFNDNLTRISERTKGLSNQIMTDLLPVINELTSAYMTATEGSNSLSGASAVIKTIFETVAVVGVNTAYVFHSVGAEIGGIVAQLTALATGDFSGAGAIGKAMKEDAEAARKEVDALTERLLNPSKREASTDKPRGNVPVLEDGAQKELDKQAEKFAQMEAQEEARAQALYDKEAEKYDKIAEIAALADLREDEKIGMKLQQDIDRMEAEKVRSMEKFNWDRELEDKHQDAISNRRHIALVEMDAFRRKEALITANRDTEQRRLMLIQKNFEESTTTAKVGTVAAILANATAVGARTNREFFEINKVASIASSIVATLEGATKALALGPLIGPPLAAMVYAGGMANVAAIASTTFGSSGGGGGGAIPMQSTDLGTPVTNYGRSVPEAPLADIPVAGVAAQETRTVNISMSGEAQLYTAQSIREQLIPALNEAAGDGVMINVVNA